MGSSLLAQCFAWCKSESLPFAVCVHLLHILRVAEHLLGVRIPLLVPFLSLVGLMLSTSLLVGCRFPAFVFHLATAIPGPRASLSADICSCRPSEMFRCQLWFPWQCPLMVSSISPRPDESFRVHLCMAASALSVNQGPDNVVHERSSSPSQARLWEIARWGHDFCGGPVTPPFVLPPHAVSIPCVVRCGLSPRPRVVSVRNPMSCLRTFHRISMKSL